MQGRADGPARFAPTGEVVGPFEVLGAIGQGAMGRVTRARQINLNRLVALKLLDDRLAHDTGQVQRFLREAKAAAALRHPNVAALIDVGSCPASGKHYIAFELVDGPSVEDLLRERGRLPEAEALSVCLGMAEAIACLEQHNLVHRDLQPSNILIGDDGAPKLIDLGLAKRLDETGSITVGAFLTTPHYVAPEQAMAMEQLDSRADLYALGITLFRCVTGALPFEGDDFLSVVTRHVNEDVPDPRDAAPDVSDGVAALVAGLCARNRDLRYTPRAAALDLRRVLDGEAPLGPDAAAAAVAAGVAPRPARAATAGLLRPEAVPEAPADDDSRVGDGSSSDLLGGAPFKLVLRDGAEGAPVERTFDQPVVTIGRDPKCDLHINDKTVSRRHAELLRNGPTFAISAHQTANGTFLNERAVSELSIVTPSDELRIAERFRIRLVPLPRGAAAGAAAPAAAPPPERNEDTSEIERPTLPPPPPEDLDAFDPYHVDPPRLDPAPAGGVPLSGLGAPGVPGARRADPPSDRLRRPEPPSDRLRRPEPPSDRLRRPDEPPSDRLRRSNEPPSDRLRPSGGTGPVAPPRPASDPPARRAPEPVREAPPPRPPSSRAPAVAEPAPARAAGGGTLVFSKGPDEQRVTVTSSFKLGKGPDCDLQLKHPHAPRKAALIVRGLDGCSLYNVAPSPNTVTVNGKPVADEVLLRDGDQIAVYGTTLRFEA